MSNAHSATESTFWQIQILPRRPELDSHGRAVLSSARQAGFPGVSRVGSSVFYFLSGDLPKDVVVGMAADLFADPVAEQFELRSGLSGRANDSAAVEVHPLPGVMNPVAQSALAAARRWLETRGVRANRLAALQTARRYVIEGAEGADELEQIARRVLANDCVETWYIHGFGRSDALPEAFPEAPRRPFELRHVALRYMSDGELQHLSREGHLFLSLEEMRAIRRHFESLGRDPTDLELETLAQTWSEHCVHKTLKAEILYRGEDFGRSRQVEVRFQNLLRETIAAATHKLNRDWCLSVFVDNAGIVAFDDEYGIAFKVETHNHPSAIEPYGGAATGIGGCIRDVMGCGLGAKPIASTDVFCLAPPDFDARRLPEGVLHPRRVLRGVVGGVRDYGNRMGIPTVNGAIHFDERYLANPLVFCGSVGLIPRKFIDKQPRPGDRIVVAGGRTGRDGIHGATFSSAELTDQHADEFSHAVQIGNAIEEKKLLDAQLLARDHPSGCLYSAVTDCGAGGLSSAVGEMGETTGAAVELARVPLKYAGLRYDEIWISEAQERMVFAVPPANLDEFLRVFCEEEVEATVIGEFTDDRVLRVTYEGRVVGEMDMAFLHDGLPKTPRTAVWTAPTEEKARGNKLGENDATSASVIAERLSAELSRWTVCSKEWVIRQYDHEVQGRSVVKPLVGPLAGPSDAAVLRPLYDSPRGIALGCGLCPQKSGGDPYWMAVAAVDEALRNVICVGADPERIAILDNFCWPKVDTEESLGALVRTCVGAAEAAVAFGLPFISGKDSLNNEFVMGENEAARTGLPQRISIPPTLLISALGMLEDVSRSVTMDFKQPGQVIALASAPVEQRGLAEARAHHRRVAGLIREGKVRAAHDVSDGGLLVAVAEMCIASGLGAELQIGGRSDLPGLFAEVSTTYVLEMNESDAIAEGLAILGRVGEEARLIVHLPHGDRVDLAVAELEQAWKSPLSAGGAS